jgi:uncharacterized protein with HEPN domain
MDSSARGLLWDALRSADNIRQFVEGRTPEDYLADRLLRSAVERQFTIIGEALSKLSKLTPTVAGRIPALREIISFRNLLIHGYAAISDARVWHILEHDLLPLRASIESLLTELGGPP